MKAISIRELHQSTGKWVRRAAAGEVGVTDRGRLVAKIVAARQPSKRPFFARPRFSRAYLAHRSELRGGTDATEVVSEGRDRGVS